MDKTIKRYFLEAHIVNHRISEKKSFPYCRYIEYELMLNTKYKIWSIFRRYSKFEELQRKLSKYIDNLPTLPKKTMFNFSEKLIEERKVGLQNYLNQIFHMINFYNNKDLLDFIDIDREVLLLMTKANTFVDYETNTRLSFAQYSPDKKIKTFNECFDKLNLVKEEKECYSDDEEQTPNEVISEFLEGLENISENKIKTVDSLVSYLKANKVWPISKREDVGLLIYGDMNTKRGLVYHCGTINENVLGAEACIKLFGMLISFEFNPDCEFYIQILKKMSLSHLKKLNLAAHIKNNNKEVCFKILRIIKEEKESLIQQILDSDEEAIKLFESWDSINL